MSSSAWSLQVEKKKNKSLAVSTAAATAAAADNNNNNSSSSSSSRRTASSKSHHNDHVQLGVKSANVRAAQTELEPEPKFGIDIGERASSSSSSSSSSPGKIECEGESELRGATTTVGRESGVKDNSCRDRGDSFSLIDVVGEVEASSRGSSRFVASRLGGECAPQRSASGPASEERKREDRVVDSAQFDKTNYQPATSELNNNSIPSATTTNSTTASTTTCSASKCASSAQRVVGSSAAAPLHSQQSPTPTPTSTPTQTLSPAALLIGLRMHANSLKSQQQQHQSEKASVHEAIVEQDAGRRFEAAPKRLDDPQPLGKFPASPQPTGSYLESSLNPRDSPTAERRHEPNLASSPYTSLFSPKRNVQPGATSAAGTSPPSPSRQRKLLPLVATSHQHQQLIHSVQRLETTSVRSSSTTTNAPTATATTAASQRGLLVKQQGLPTQSTGDSLVSTRSLFSTTRSQPSPSGDTSKRLPSIFDHSHAWTRQPLDYDLVNRKLVNPKSTSRLQHLRKEDLSSAQEITIEDEGDDQSESLQEDHDDDDQDLDDEEVQHSDNITPEPYIEPLPTSRQPRQFVANLRQTSDKSNLLNDSKDPNRRISASPSGSPSPESHQYQKQHQSRKSKASLFAPSRYPGQSQAVSSRARASQRGSRSRMSTESGASGSTTKKAVQQNQQRTRLGDASQAPSLATAAACRQQQLDMRPSGSCRKLDLIEQVSHMDCNCHMCLKSRKLIGLHDIYQPAHHHQNLVSAGSVSKLSTANLNGGGHHYNGVNIVDSAKYPKTRFMHMVLKSIILVLCTLLLLLLLVGTILISHYLPQSMDKVLNVSRSFNVTIAGRR